MRNIFSLIAFLIFIVTTITGYSEVVTTAHWGGFPTPITAVAEETTKLYNFIFWILSVVALVVLIPILISLFKFRRKNNPVPAKFSHNTFIEIAWTTIPAIICLVITYKAYEAMVFINKMPEEGITIEAIAYQFGWDFYYPDFSKEGENLAAAEPTKAHKALSLPKKGIERFVKDLVVPIDTFVKLDITASDVIHAFFAPALGIKIDAIPGRINYAWFKAEKEGDFIGQCAELCGSAHGEMFFNVKVVSKAAFADYINTQRKEAGWKKLTQETILKTLVMKAAAS